MKRRGWSSERITLVIYPFAAGAAGVNVFFASLLSGWIGWPMLSTAWSFGLGCILGVPAALAFARHIRRLMDLAEPKDVR